jgi:hypothetical protein
MFRHFVRILLIGALGTALAIAATPVAVAQEPSVITASLTGNATLVAKGAAVDVEVLYSCFSEFPESISVASVHVFGLTQRVSGGRIATGEGTSFEQLVCDGAEHMTTDRVVAGGGLAFKKGDAVAQGSATLCDPGCIFTPFQGIVRIR